MKARRRNGQRNASELLFEEYLRLQGYTEWEYEPAVGKRRPDYRLTHHDSSLYFEVKEFDAPKVTHELRWFNPYKGVRKKITRAAGQFKEFKAFPCSLVLSNLNGAIVQLGNPRIIMAAMLGDLAFEVPVDLPQITGKHGRTVFSRHGGKMVDEKRQEPENTTVSSIIVLGTYSLHEKRIDAEARKRRLDRHTSIEDAVKEALKEEMGDQEDKPRVRVVVYENPFARMPLSRDLFRGPFDERWGKVAGSMRKIFVGEKIVQAATEL